MFRKLKVYFYVVIANVFFKYYFSGFIFSSMRDHLKIS